MNTSYATTSNESYFTDAINHLNVLITELQSEALAQMEHGDIEQHINEQGHEVMRRLLQGHFDRLAANEEQAAIVTSSEEKSLTHMRSHTQRTLVSQFGKVKVTRKSYGQKNEVSRFPLDKHQNFPDSSYSDGLTRHVALEALKGSFDNAIETINRTTAGHIPKRQSLQLVHDVSQDFEAYYQQNRVHLAEDTSDLLILTFDGKGVVMRKEGLRECTRKNAEKSNKLESRLSPGEKKDRKRMAMVAAVYTVAPHKRTAQSVMNLDREDDNILPFRTPARNKRVWASLEREAEDVIREAFEEARQRDPEQKRAWVILIDGLPHQIKMINKVKNEMNLEATIVMDFIHVLEYLWKAAWCFFDKGDPLAEKWIAK